MDKHASLTSTPEEVLNTIRELRQDVARHDQQLHELMAYLGQLPVPFTPGRIPPNEKETSHQAELLTPGWMPSNTSGNMISDVQTPRKIRKIPAHQDNSADVVSRLRASWPGRVYRSRLKHFALIRWLAQLLWRTTYPIYINHIATRLANGKAKRWLPLTTLGEYAARKTTPTDKLADAAVVETPAPMVFPAGDQGYLASPHPRYQFPEVVVATIPDATIYGGTNLVLVDDEVLCHDLYDFARDYTSEELHGRTLIDARSRRIRWLLHDPAPEPIPVAATFVDACAPNYAHWLTEVLPRIALFCAEERFLGIPVVVNDGLHKNIMESLILVAGAGREIITLPIGRALTVKELHLTSAAGYVPFERRESKLSGHSHGMFNPHALEIVRNRLLAVAGQMAFEEYPQRVILRRNSAVRKLTSAREIEQLLVDAGYSVVEPDKLSFIQQVQLFAHARVVVASSGAALANIIFCPPATEIWILISRHPDTSYWYWQNMAAASNNSVRYFLGEAAGGISRSIHDDFFISPDEVLQTLSRRSAS